MEWISVRDYLPESSKAVLYYSELGAWFIGALYDGKWHNLSDQKPIDKNFHITHWMPLPEPPDGK